MIIEIKDKTFLPQIIKLEKLLFNETSYTDVEFDKMMLDEHYKIIACFDGVVLGYVIIYKNVDFQEIFKIGVNPDYQRNGIGAQLIQYLQEKYKRIYLEVSSENDNAISFYKKHNFRQNGLRKNYYGKGNDGILMEWCSDF